MSVAAVARRVARLLKAADRKVVFAESCTGGLVSGALTAVPGISSFHCGGVVVYRDGTKTAYLGISPRLLASVGTVSREVAEQMAKRALEKTPEADIAVSVTGHLGPAAPRKLDGLVFVGIARRRRKLAARDTVIHELHCQPRDSRTVRQQWVVEQALDLLVSYLKTISGSDDGT